MDSLISVIIPVYNVERFLNECIDSILNQTYKNFEILLIDDGSTDSSSSICDDYAHKYKSVCVYHKKNGGLSDARNYGIKHSNGEYITFIDSDDYVENNYLEVLYSAITSNDADISVSNYRRVDETGAISFDLNTGEDGVLSSHEALKNLFYQNYISVSASAKLYKKSIFDNICFSNGKLYEDILAVPQFFLAASKIAYVHDCLLNYRIRSGSITQSKFKVRDIDMLSNSLYLLDLINEKGINSLRLPAISYVFSKASTLLFLLDKSKDSNVDVMKYKIETWTVIKKIRKNIIFDKEARRMNRYGALLTYLGMKFYCFIYNVLKGGE